MSERSYLDERLQDREFSRRFAIEGALVDASESVLEAMGEKGYRKSDMAEVLGINIAQVSRALNGSHNFTVKTLASLLWACGRKLVIKSEPYKSFKKEIIWEKKVDVEYSSLDAEIIKAKIENARYHITGEFNMHIGNQSAEPYAKVA